MAADHLSAATVRDSTPGPDCAQRPSIWLVCLCVRGHKYTINLSHSLSIRSDGWRKNTRSLILGVWLSHCTHSKPFIYNGLNSSWLCPTRTVIHIYSSHDEWASRTRTDCNPLPSIIRCDAADGYVIYKCPFSGSGETENPGRATDDKSHFPPNCTSKEPCILALCAAMH